LGRKGGPRASVDRAWAVSTRGMQEGIKKSQGMVDRS
jgi:hypothetical protein